MNSSSSTLTSSSSADISATNASTPSTSTPPITTSATTTTTSSSLEREIVIRSFMIPDNSIIDLSHVDMASSNFFKLCQCIKNSKLSSNKTEYNLSLCNIEEKKFPLLYEALSTLTNEFSLILNFNKLNSLQAVQDMKRIFNDLVKLKSLSLDGTRLGNIGLIELSSTIFMTKTLTSLSLDSNHLSFDGIVVFSKILPQIPSLKILILRGNDLSEEKSLQVLSTNVILSNIQTLSLDMCQISPTSVRPLGSLLTQSRTLTSLNLSSNHLNSMGMRLLVDGLGENFYLHTLCLAGCFIGLQGLTYLTATLVDNDTLRSLDLSRIHAHEEPFGEEGGKLIADMLTLNRGITNLNLYWQCIGTKGAINIAVALDSNRTIRTLNLGGNYIGPEGVRRLETSLGITAKLSKDRPISSWVGSSPLTPLLLNRNSAYLRRLSHGSGTPQLSRGNSFNNTPRSGSISRTNSFNNGRQSRTNSVTRINTARGSFKDINVPRLSTTPRTLGDGNNAWVPLSPNHELLKTRQPSARNMRNTITDPQSRRKSTQFFESSFTGGATDDFLTKRTTPLNNGSPTPSAYSSQSKRRMSNFPQLSTGAGAPVITPLLPVDILPPALQGTISSPEKPK